MKSKLIALLFANLCFFVSFVTGMVKGQDVFDVLVLATLCALVAYGVGYICGYVIEEIFLETIDHHATEERKEEDDALEKEKEELADKTKKVKSERGGTKAAKT